MWPLLRGLGNNCKSALGLGTQTQGYALISALNQRRAAPTAGVKFRYEISLDNNAAERAMRSIAVGRKTVISSLSSWAPTMEGKPPPLPTR